MRFVALFETSGARTIFHIKPPFTFNANESIILRLLKKNGTNIIVIITLTREHNLLLMLGDDMKLVELNISVTNCV